MGFGFEVALAFLDEGASVALCARNEERLNQAVEKLATDPDRKSRVLAVPTDISSQSDVRRLMETVIRAFGGLDILLCNAGVYGPKGAIDQVDLTEWVRAIEINLLGTVFPCREAIPYLKRQPGGKIIIMSGGGATNPMPFLSAYAASKAAVVRFAETLAGETSEFGISVNTVAPGALNTRLLDEVIEAGPDKVGQSFYDKMVGIKKQGGTPLEVGAALCVFLGSDESNGITGKLISAVWDPWKDLPGHLPDLIDTDIYTLRRIVPGDRGKEWG
ncbi:MAG: SDR family oxidoreductase [Deltaproteobacteria bacterium]|nr:SDR family oxidoreductase [Deltaproteobacteria bacterium]MBF0525011.1 SDR family oxidoreductase [Deltaproteobacteria bacterium]